MILIEIKSASQICVYFLTAFKIHMVVSFVGCLFILASRLAYPPAIIEIAQPQRKKIMYIHANEMHQISGFSIIWICQTIVCAREFFFGKRTIVSVYCTHAHDPTQPIHRLPLLNYLYSVIIIA